MHQIFDAKTTFCDLLLDIVGNLVFRYHLSAVNRSRRSIHYDTVVKIFLVRVDNLEYFTSMNANLSAEEILTVGEVASYLKVTGRSIYSLLSKDEIPGFKVGGSWRFRKDEIERWTKGKAVVTSLEMHEDPEVYGRSSRATELKIQFPTNDRDSISRSFFEHPETVLKKVKHGVIETPLQVARFIVRQAYGEWKKINKRDDDCLNAIEWFDPCCGAGVFVEAILEHCFNLEHITSETELPKITLAEISPIGIKSTLQTISLFLKDKGLDLQEYRNSGRLKIYNEDVLMLLPERKEIFGDTHCSFDIIVGNPPYVRSTNLDKKYKEYLKRSFPSVFDGNADLYSYFVASGVMHLKDNGILCFISPAGFTRAKNGQALRGWLANHCSIAAYFDLDETRVFPNADLHSVIYIMSRQINEEKLVKYSHVTNLIELDDLFHDKRQAEFRYLERPKEQGWIFHASIACKEDFAASFRNCMTLEQLGIKVYSGVRPGVSKAFIVNETTYMNFSEAARRDWFKPLILPADILRWNGKKELNYMLVIPAEVKEIDQEITDYLLPYKTELLRRTEISKNINWFNLRPCTYYCKIDAPKIIFPDLSSHQRFSFDPNGHYITDGAYFIESSDLALLGILNSDLAKGYFANRCSSVGNLAGRGRYRFKKIFVQSFPVPADYQKESEIKVKIAEVVKLIISDGESVERLSELNRLVKNIYSGKS